MVWPRPEERPRPPNERRQRRAGPPGRAAPGRLQVVRRAHRSIEFGPGISAVVGPNGSGKSNLADALRWTLGEQGRLLRTRRAEDVIFAGSSARRAIGMADVTLVIDNSDRLLPVDYGEVELGRRLYRSGENEYLLNRQRIRLRDLVELLDAGNLADNAFLFIGQGMVDQALALRPEERRPLFEEAAGVRRHERRRRQAESELAEAESNLDRLRDLLAELRPQARRLAAQAEQLEARRSAGAELADAVLGAARAHWTATARAAQRDERELAQARGAADAALDRLRAAEGEAGELAAAIARQAETERNRREELDAERARLGELRVEAARLDSEAAGLTRQRTRAAGERALAEERSEAARHALAVPRPAGNRALADELRLVEQRLSDLEGDAAPDDEPATRGRVAVGEAELSNRRRQVAELGTTLADLRARLAELEPRRAEAARGRAAATSELEQLVGRTEQLAAQVEESRGAADQAAAAAQHDRRRALDEDAQLTAARAELGGLEAALRAGRNEQLSRAARARGAQLLGEGLEVEPRFGAAVGAVLGSWAAAFVVDDEGALALASRGGRLVVDDPAHPAGAASASPTQARAVADAAAAHGGGQLIEAVRRDARGVASRLLRDAVWLPDLNGALAVQAALPAGWRAVTLAGEVVDHSGLLALAGQETTLEQAHRRDEAALQVAQLERSAAQSRDAAETRASELAEARRRLGELERELGEHRRRWRVADEAERAAHRRLDQLEREAAWLSSRLETGEAELVAAERLRAEAETELSDMAGRRPVATQDAARAERRAALAARLDELRSAQAAADAALERWQEARRRADVGLGLDAARVAELEAEEHQLLELEATLAASRDAVAAEVAQRALVERQLAGELHDLLAAAAGDRTRLADAEKRASDARERLRGAEQSSRRLELAAIERRLQLEQQREQLLVELAGIGTDGRLALLAAAGLASVEVGEDTADEDAATEIDVTAALARLTERWLAEPTDEAAPSANRLATLRRRFHDLGAGNPFAVEEYAEVRDRLEGLEAQRADLEEAIRSTRELIASLEPAHHGPVPAYVRGARGCLRAPFQRAVRRRRGAAQPDRIPRTSRPPASRSTRGRRARSASHCRCSPAASGRSPRSACCWPCSRCGRCRSACSTRSTRPWTRPMWAASRKRCAAWPSRRSSS